MPKNVACRFYLQGRCLRGAQCPFYHGPQTAAAVEVCRFYQRGFCAAGEGCRFLHPSHLQVDGGDADCWEDLGAAMGFADVAKAVDSDEAGLVDTGNSEQWWDEGSKGLEGPQYPDIVDEEEEDAFDQQTWEECMADQTGPEWRQRALCPHFVSTGRCPTWRRCPHPHGRLCETCGRWCLHPYSEAQRIRHSQACADRADRAASAASGAALECAICLEVVMSKPPPERQFGLLACAHPFCLGCVRGWRSQALRCCPICRQATHFVTPSKVWPRSAEEKEAIVSRYKARLAGIDCKYWEQSAPGDRRCPFGTSCFYRHKGAEDMPAPRKFLSADGEVKFGTAIHLSDFLEDLRL